jgi:hypothetical protein
MDLLSYLFSLEIFHVTRETCVCASGSTSVLSIYFQILAR